ncbi:hypothetical protein DITRI_Ditri06bG0009900 [Diplodiscus trichospermus]
MISDMLEVEADSGYLMESKTMSTTTESSFDNQGGRNRERTEPGKKMMKKLRSIKLSRIPSTRKGRSSSSQLRAMLSGYAASSEQSSPMEMSDASPNHSFKLLRSMSRKPSMKFRRSQMKKSSGGTELKKKLKKSSRRSEVSFDPASPNHSQSCFDEQDKKILPDEKQNFRVIRTSTLGPVRILTKMASLKAKRSSSRKCSEISSISDPSIERATCSSILKDSKFPDHLEIKPGGSESDGNAALNVCRYSYCSLHGHHHGDRPPLKRFGSMRRRMVKNQKSLKQDSQSSGKEKHSGNRKKGIKTDKRIAAVEQSIVDIGEISSVPGKEGSGIGAEQHKATCDVGSETSEFDKLSLEPGKTMSTCDERVPVDDEAHRDVNQDAASCLNFEENRSHSENGVDKSETVSASEENNEDSELDHGMLQPVDSMAASSTDVACKTEMENQKNFTFWKLIYQNMATGLDAELETQKPLPGANSEEQVENLCDAHEKNNSPREDHKASNQKIEFSQSDAIKLVQQAFDKILSEIPDHSSDDQSIAGEVTSDQDFLLKKQEEGNGVSIPTSSNSIEDCTVQDHEETPLQTDQKLASEEVKTAQMEGKKSDKQMPSSWSNLKKIIILRRFVKSLEKVRNLKPRTIRHLPMDKDSEAAKIQLRHQNMKGRKNAEEWMLDHALRQVISTLAPSQKRKVALLVQAFETVIPLPETGDNMRSNAAASSPTMSVPAYNESLVHNCNSTKTENGSEIPAGKALYPEINSKDDQDQVSESHTACQQILEASCEPKETSLLSGCTEKALCVAGSEMSGPDMTNDYSGTFNDDMVKEGLMVMDAQPKFVDLSLSEEARRSNKSRNEGAVRTSHEKFFPINEEAIKRISKEEIPVVDSEVCSEGSEFNIKKMDKESSDVINSADQHPGKPECHTGAGEGAQSKFKILHSSLEQSESNFAGDISKSERQKYMRLWYLIYKHMVSGNAAENGSQPLQNVADEEVQGDHACKHSRDNNAEFQGSVVDQNKMENYTKGSIECHNNEIIKLVEQAIDEIPLPEIQDDTSDYQSDTGAAIRDQELQGKKHGEEEVKFISGSTHSAKENSKEANSIRAELRSTLNPEEETLKSETMSTKKAAERGSEEGNQSKKRVQRNWSNLKKLILLRRFAKALEKVKEFNPQGPRYLPLDPAPESEKVLLRRQNMEDRKNAEEWMLDYALQQVVAKLTPERKRRVGLLVEAFETVIPTIS